MTNSPRTTPARILIRPTRQDRVMALSRTLDGGSAGQRRAVLLSHAIAHYLKVLQEPYLV